MSFVVFSQNIKVFIQITRGKKVTDVSRKNVSSGIPPEQAAVDPRITYPCYKSFDEFIDVTELRSLDGYISEKIKHYMKAQDENYFLSAYRLDSTSPHQPGAREIWLSKPKFDRPNNYDELNKTDLWELTEEAGDFPLLMDFIETLPFKATGRMLIIYDDVPREVPAHRDHLKTDICYEFVWLRTNLKKPLYMLAPETCEKLYVESYSAWFDSVNQFHGVDPKEGLSFSIRIDGLFNDEFRKRIPVPDFNAASTPALWACLSR